MCLCFRSILSHVFLWRAQACCLSSGQLTVNILWVHNWYQELHHGLRPASGSWFNPRKVPSRTDLALYADVLVLWFLSSQPQSNAKLQKSDLEHFPAWAKVI